MHKITDYKEQLSLLLEKMKDQSSVVEEEKKSLLSYIPDPFGVAVEQDSGITETRVFITHFSVNDVNDFIALLLDNPPLKHRYNLESLLKENLEDWCYDHPGDCPYEPFLWALKISDNYIGSLQNNAIPQPWIVEAVGNALYSVWDENNQKFFKVLRNVLDSWDWYQPIHVMLYLYGCLSSVNNSDVDRCIREKWLYRALYSKTAFNCLCKKKKTRENIQALMRFVSQDIQRDSNMAEIQITRKMRLEMNSYIQSMSDEEYAWAKTYYIDSLYNCSRKARQSFEKIFIDEPNDDVKKFISDWKINHTETEIRALKKKLNNLFQRDSDTLISEVAYSKSDELVSEVLSLVEDQKIVFETQFFVRAIVKNANICKDYYEFIISRFAECDPEFADDKSFIYGCAFCQLGHPELLERLFVSHFLKSVGLINGRYIFSDLRIFYSKQFNDQVDKLTNFCLSDENSALTLVLSCSKIYTTKNITAYPVSFDKVCKMLLEKVLDEDQHSARYASALMDLYECIVGVSNRGRYKDPLQQIALETHVPALDGACRRAKKVIRRIYGAL